MFGRAVDYLRNMHNYSDFTWALILLRWPALDLFEKKGLNNPSTMWRYVMALSPCILIVPGDPMGFTAYQPL